MEAPDSITSYTYDPENRLLTAKANGNAATYAGACPSARRSRDQEDPKGRRNTKTYTGTTTYFLDEGDDEIAELDGGTQQIVRYYVPGPAIDEPIAMVPASGSYE
ncbi:MAG: hypothetical protein ACREHF_11620 [Rhizomicrobium sp.]